MTRAAVESQFNFPGGRLFFDAANGNQFRPDAPVTKIVAAVALVKAANLQSLVSATPLSVADIAQIPTAYRGYVAVALKKGLLSADDASFDPNRSLTRVESAQAIVRLNHLAIE